MKRLDVISAPLSSSIGKDADTYEDGARSDCNLKTLLQRLEAVRHTFVAFARILCQTSLMGYNNHKGNEAVLHCFYTHII
jgi:hypothetical protein